MAFFDYKARNRQGQLSQGQLEAATREDAASSLMTAGLMPVDITASKSQGSNTSSKWQQFLKGGIKLETLLILCSQFASLTRAGIPILRIVESLRDTTDNKQLAQILKEVGEGLNQGQTLSDCLALHPNVFNELFINLIGVGESTGQLELAFLQLSHYFQLELDTKRRVKAATRYPMFVSIAMLGAMVVLNIFVIPAFSGIFNDLGADLPWTTKLLINSSAFFTTYIVHLIVGTIIGSILIWQYVKTKQGELQWHYWQMKIPLIGPLINRIIMARFCRSFAMMLKAGMPIVSVIDLAGAATGNAYLTRAILAMGERLAQGSNLTDVATESEVFTPLILQMFKVGEETGRVDEMVMEAGRFYEEQVDYDITNLTAKIEPILITMISAMVLVLALGIFTPMWDMLSLIQG